MDTEFLGGRVIVTVGDLTVEATDAIVNAANSSLLGGGGVDGAIHRKGGPQILEECRQIRATLLPDGLPTGEAVVTSGGLLLAKFVIHTVGPVYGQNAGRDAELLANCYLSSLCRAAQLKLTSVAFPSISTGVYGFPKEEAAIVVSRTLSDFLTAASPFDILRLVFHTEADEAIFLRHAKF